MQTGLINPQNWCFPNAVLQGLKNCVEFTCYMETLESDETMEIHAILVKLFTRMMKNEGPESACEVRVRNVLYNVLTFYKFKNFIHRISISKARFEALNNSFTRYYYRML